eukprot:TRINITY_DN645_c0_g2_i1.p1 TRINITY_DN645_c0_g2~~TRINITY_DN645_c0_g2_i1.p1  ORF type:complete len:522 (+),score=153.18 TRINITY_DN645_c0_g2_i1:1521-3086(+)
MLLSFCLQNHFRIHIFPLSYSFTISSLRFHFSMSSTSVGRKASAKSPNPTMRDRMSMRTMPGYRQKEDIEPIRKHAFLVRTSKSLVVPPSSYLAEMAQKEAEIVELKAKVAAKKKMENDPNLLWMEDQIPPSLREGKTSWKKVLMASSSKAAPHRPIQTHQAYFSDGSVSLSSSDPRLADEKLANLPIESTSSSPSSRKEGTRDHYTRSPKATDVLSASSALSDAMWLGEDVSFSKQPFRVSKASGGDSSEATAIPYTLSGSRGPLATSLQSRHAADSDADADSDEVDRRALKVQSPPSSHGTKRLLPGGISKTFAVERENEKIIRLTRSVATKLHPTVDRSPFEETLCMQPHTPKMRLDENRGILVFDREKWKEVVSDTMEKLRHLADSSSKPEFDRAVLGDDTVHLLETLSKQEDLSDRESAALASLEIDVGDIRQLSCRVLLLEEIQRALKSLRTHSKAMWEENESLIQERSRFQEDEDNLLLVAQTIEKERVHATYILEEAKRKNLAECKKTETKYW